MTNEYNNEPSRSQQLYNTRKNTVFERIYFYLIEKIPKTVQEFSNMTTKQSRTKEIGCSMIVKHPHLPNFIKKIFAMMTEEMK